MDPVIVRVKRKSDQSLLDDALCLEIDDRSFKRTKKVIVRHLETVSDPETTIDIIKSFFESDHTRRKRDFEDREQSAAENARFEQIRGSMKGNKELHDHKCRFYDVIRVDAEERPELNAAECKSMEEQRKLSRYLPLLREFLPTAAQEIEADDDNIHSSHAKDEEYVYDFYYYAAVKEEVVDVISSKNQFPLVKVEDGEGFCCDEPAGESGYGSEDSNAEDYVMECCYCPAGKVEEMSEPSDGEETSKRHVGRVLGDQEFDCSEVNGDGDRESSDEEENGNGDRESSDEEELEYSRRRKGEVCVPSGDTFFLF